VSRPEEVVEMRTVVVGIDASRHAQVAVGLAGREARLREAQLRAVHAHRLPLAFAGTAVPLEAIDPQGHRVSMALLQHALESRADDLEGLEVEQRVVPCTAVGRTLVAESADADLLVVGARGTGRTSELRLGSVSDHVARHAECPVLLAPTEEPRHDGPVVVGVDGSPAADEALRWALAEAARRAVPVQVVHVYLPYTAHRPFGADFMEAAAPGSLHRLQQAGHTLVAEVLDRVPPGDVPVTTHVVGGNPAEALVDAARDASLLVVGPRGVGGVMGHLLGSTSRRVLHRLAVPTVVVRARTRRRGGPEVVVDEPLPVDGPAG
jgi:nucleotide-binding universal stress UspA family protein